MCDLELCCGLCDLELCCGGSNGAPERKDKNIQTEQPTNSKEEKTIT